MPVRLEILSPQELVLTPNPPFLIHRETQRPFLVKKESTEGGRLLWLEDLLFYNSVGPFTPEEIIKDFFPAKVA